MLTKKWIRRLALSWGLSASLCSVAVAQEVASGRRGTTYYPPAVVPCPQPAMPIIVAPTTPAKPDAKPSDLPPGETQPQQQQPQAQPPADASTPPSTDFSAGADQAAGAPTAGDTGLASVGMTGRGDQSGRFNLFDNMTAIPRSQVWFGYQLLSGYRTGIEGFTTASTPALGHSASIPGSRAIPGLTGTRNQALWRVGGEVAFSDNFSIAGQTQYTSNYGTGESGDSWANPQLLAKYAVINEPDGVLSATLGLQPQTSISDDQLREETTRIVPGFLFYRPMGEDLFVQGGAQFGIVTSTDAANTFDYAVSFGYWLYRHGSLMGCGSGNSGCETRPFVVGLVPQVEFLAKHVINQGKNFSGSGLVFSAPDSRGTMTNAVVSPNNVIFAEGRNVFDITFGSRILFRNNMSLGTGFSFPISGAVVRNAEFISTLNYAF